MVGRESGQRVGERQERGARAEGDEEKHKRQSTSSSELIAHKESCSAVDNAVKMTSDIRSGCLLVCFFPHVR